MYGHALRELNHRAANRPYYNQGEFGRLGGLCRTLPGRPATAGQRRSGKIRNEIVHKPLDTPIASDGS
jgi:hypothetical protein